MSNVPCTRRNATVDSRMPTTFLATHWYRPSSDWRASWIARLPPSTMRTLQRENNLSHFHKTNAPSGMQPRNTLTVLSYSCPWFGHFFAKSRPVRGTPWADHTPAGPSLPGPPACSGAPVESLHVTLKQKKANKKKIKIDRLEPKLLPAISQLPKHAHAPFPGRA